MCMGGGVRMLVAHVVSASQQIARLNELPTISLKDEREIVG